MDKQQIINKIGKENWNKFLDFMEGQTSSMKNGEFDYYSIDVDNFINKLKDKPYFFD